MLEMQIETVARDPFNNHVVILRELDGNRVLPIWIGTAEALAIALELRGEKPPRPLTHDLMRNILDELGVRVVRVVIHDLVDRTYYAYITLETPFGIREIDSRPSDALALALRTNAPVYISGNVIDSLISITNEEDDDWERFQRLIDELEEET
ncbi:MAG: hypothetical protein HZRFUVUK_000002 [Candidatus Fervidibacterota bacterium]|jgi:bifunctional DNase/RNase